MRRADLRRHADAFRPSLDAHKRRARFHLYVTQRQLRRLRRVTMLRLRRLRAVRAFLWTKTGLSGIYADDARNRSIECSNTDYSQLDDHKRPDGPQRRCQ